MAKEKSEDNVCELLVSQSLTEDVNVNVMKPRSETLQFSDEIGEVQSCFLYNSRPHSASPKGR